MRNLDIEVTEVKRLGKRLKKENEIYLIKFNPQIKVEKVIEKLKKHPEIEFVEPNYIKKKCRVSNDYSSYFWWHEKIQAPLAWDITTGSEEIVIGILDTGIDYTHEDLAQNIWINPGEIPDDGIDNDGNGYIDDMHGIFPQFESGDPMDLVDPIYMGHGTRVAGIIGAVGNNAKGVVGVNWKVKMVGCVFIQFVSEIVSCMDYFIDLKERGINIKAINGSYGGGYSSIEYLKTQELKQKGILFIVSAGNERSNNDLYPQYPCNYNLDNIICVAATDEYDNLALFSNYGNSVHIAAPGVNIKSTYILDLNQVSQGNPIFWDNLENGGINWDFTSSAGLTNDFYHSPYTSMGFAKRGNYPNNAIIDITSKNINLEEYKRGQNKLIFGFYYYPLISDWADIVSLNVYKRGRWLNLIEIDGETLGEDYGEWNIFGFYIPKDFRNYDFKINFKLETDGSYYDRGVFFDDLGILNFNFPTNNYIEGSGTSFATPFVTGVSALIWSRAPNLSYLEVKDIILKSVDKLSQLSGKVATSGRINAYKALSSLLSCAPPFPDVPCDHWAVNEIRWAKGRGITTGYPDGTYRPEVIVTREQMAAFIIRARYGENFSYDPRPHFNDVPPSRWSFRYVQRLYEDGITVGCGG
ncbi:MAG: S8 family serine peptidase, partial [candidate division WOR-3 bacterium]